MAQQIKSFGDHYSGFLRHIKLAVATFSAVVLVGVIVAFSLQDMYRSQALIMIEEQDIPTNLVQTTVTVYATRQISSLNERIMTTSNLVNIIEKFDLYAKERESTPARLLARRAKERIEIKFINAEATTPQGALRSFVAAFTVGFQDEDPEKAQEVTSELVSLYMAENLRARTEATAETKQFIDDEVATLDRQVLELETRLAEFKEANADSLPSLNMVNLQMMQRVDSQLLEIERRLYGIEENRIAIEAQLATVKPTQPTRLADGQMVMSPADQLEALKTQLTLIEGRYSDSHPDVIKVRADIAALQRRFGLDVEPAQLQQQLVETRAELAIASETYSDDHPDVIRLQAKIDELQATRQRYADATLENAISPDNPAYIQLQTQLNTLQIDERALRAERDELRKQLTDYEARLMRTPQVERKMAALSRELSSVSNRYWVLRDKQFGAQIGQNLELQSKGERFALVEPAAVPLRPFAPDRLAIILLAVLMGFVFGVAITQVADALDDAIYTSAAVSQVQGSPPIIEVPLIVARNEGVRSLSPKVIVLGSIPVAVMGLLLLVHLVVRPLDVLFYSLLRTLGF
jgi:polysaccharide biosynthesis transport protein